MKSSSDSNQMSVKLTLSAGFASVLVAGLLVAMKLWAFSETGALSIAASLTDSALDLRVGALHVDPNDAARVEQR